MTTTMADPIVIRRAETPAEFRALQEAQRQAWGVTEANYIVPVATMVGAQLHGGLVLGAFLPDGTAVGLSFAFLGRIEGRLGLYSQLTGVVPGYQGRRLGERLKFAQREHARAAGLDLIAWAFDPLQAGNAHFNLARLGATVGHYVDNMYGPRTDELNAGTPTDRLIAVWETHASGPGPTLDPQAALRLPRLVATAPRPDGWLDVEGVSNELPFPAGLLEIPADIRALRERDPQLAERWRLAVRKAFLAAFTAGYRAVGFAREDESGSSRRGYYVLQHEG